MPGRPWQRLRLIVERDGPVIVGILAIFTDLRWLHLNIIHQTWTDNLLNRVITAAAIVLTFWGIAVTLLIAMESRQTIVRLKRLGFYVRVVQYFSEGFVASFILLILSILLQPVSGGPRESLWSASWFGCAIWATLAAVRSYLIFSRLLQQS